MISLAISEAFAGSDVSGLRTSAVKSEDGKTWWVLDRVDLAHTYDGCRTINGTKKWISGGMHSDYFVCRLVDGGTTLITHGRLSARR